MGSLEERYRSVLAKLPADTSLVAVSKTFDSSHIQALYDLGHRHFGENKVQELEGKAKELFHSCPDIKWHFIGHLQTNKVKSLLKIPNLYAIHSIDSDKLWSELLKHKNLPQNSLNLFLEINIANEANKSGLPFDKPRLILMVEKIKCESASTPYKLVGLMGMGPIQTADFVSDTRKSFHLLQQLRDELDPNLQLSMGMSQDFEIAVENHSNWVRIGSFLFGSRVI